MLLHMTTRVFRLGVALGLVAAVLIMPAAPGNAAAPHVDFTLFALPPALTLGAAHSGLVKAIVHANNTTATHVQVTLTTSQNVTLTFTSAGCPTPAVQATLGPNQPLICRLPNVNTNSTASVVVQFQSPESAAKTCPTVTNATVPCLAIGSTLTFAEGNGTNGNDTITRSSDIELVTSTNAGGSAGDCFPLGVNATIGTTASASVVQATQAQVKDAAADRCTPAAVGAKSIPPNAALHLNQAWFVEFPTLAGNGLTTATLSVFNPPGGVNQNNFALMRFATDIYGSTTFNAGLFQTVQSCVNGALPPNADSCILAVSSLPGSQGGFSISLLLLPSGDASFGG